MNALLSQTKNVSIKKIARLSAQRGGALKSYETEKCKHKAEPQSAARHDPKLHLLSVQMNTVARQHQHHYSKDHNKRCRFDPKHQPRRNLHVAARNPRGHAGNDDRQKNG